MTYYSDKWRAESREQFRRIGSVNKWVQIFACKKGHQFESGWSTIYCPGCSAESLAEFAEKDAEKVRRLGNRHGLKLLGPYVDGRTPVLYECPAGHRRTDQVYYDTDCPSCRPSLCYDAVYIVKLGGVLLGRVPVFKIGSTSRTLGTRRPEAIADYFHTVPEIAVLAPVDRALKVEKAILELGTKVGFTIQGRGKNRTAGAWSLDDCSADLFQSYCKDWRQRRPPSWSEYRALTDDDVMAARRIIGQFKPEGPLSAHPRHRASPGNLHDLTLPPQLEGG